VFTADELFVRTCNLDGLTSALLVPPTVGLVWPVATHRPN